MNRDINLAERDRIEPDEESKVGQGYNDARGEIPDKKDIPKHNGQNLNNDPAHHRAKEVEAARVKKSKSKKTI